MSSILLFIIFLLIFLTTAKYVHKKYSLRPPLGVLFMGGMSFKKCYEKWVEKG